MATTTVPTTIKPEALELAREYGVASVCIKPYYVHRAAELLAGSTVAVGTTIGFPHGGHARAIKVAESLPLADRFLHVDVRLKQAPHRCAILHL